MNYSKQFFSTAGANLRGHHLGRRLAGALALLVLLPLPSLAHHPTGGQVPDTVFEGFLSGLAHPVIGLDHLAFVVAVGLLAALSPWGVGIPIVFVLAAMVGTGLHLAAVTLPAAELVIAASVLGFGVLLALPNRPQGGWIAVLAGLAGLFHGFAYGEAIFGAEPMPLVAYLAGFTTVQMAIAIAAFLVGRQLAQRSLPLQRAGLVICGIGATLLATILLEAALAA